MGLLRIVTNDEIEASKQPDVDTRQLSTGLASTIQRQWEINKNHKINIEQIMLESLQQRNGEYDAKTLSEIRNIGGSDIFMPLTGMQCNAAASWINSIVLPAGEKAWTIKPTPSPELPSDIEDKVAQDVQQMMISQGVPPDQFNDIMEQGKKAIRQDIEQYAAEAASRMEEKIEDQLIDSDYTEAMEDFIDDIVTYPAAFIKTTYKTKKSIVTVNNAVEVKEELVEHDERVSPFDMFPSPGQTTINDGKLIERLHLSRSQLFDCIGKPGYKEEEIRAALSEHDTGGSTPWETSTDTEVKTTQGYNMTTSHDDGLITGLRFMGSVSGRELIEWGMSVEMVKDPLGEVEIEAILVGTHVVKAVPNLDPLKKRPYFKASYRNNPGSFWGKSIPELVRSHQRMCNAAARALSNNMSMASGPMVQVNIDRIPAGETISGLHPWKVFQTVTDPNGNNAPPVNFFQPNSNAQELMGIYQTYWEQAGDVTGVWKGAYGADPSRMAQGAQTAQGMALLHEGASKQIRSVVKHIDTGVVKPRIEAQYHANMMYADNDDIKGDMQVQAIGASVLVAKSVQSARRNEFLAITNNPIDMELIGPNGRAELLRKMLKDMDMTDILPDDEALSQQLSQQQEQAPQQDPKITVAEMNTQARIADQKLEMQNAEREREVRLQVAQMENQRAMYELAQRYNMNLETLQQKLKETAIKERSENARMQAELQAKQQFGSGI